MTRFTDVESAVDEAHFIQDKLKETALITMDKQGDLYVITRNQYESADHNTNTVLEICSHEQG